MATLTAFCEREEAINASISRWTRRASRPETSAGRLFDAVSSLLLALASAVFFDPRPAADDPPNDTYNRGALGYSALARFLEASDYEVHTSRSDASTGVLRESRAAGSLLVLLEPPVESPGDAQEAVANRGFANTCVSAGNKVSVSHR